MSSLKSLDIAVKRVRYIKTSDNKYDAIIDMAISGRELKIIIPCLTKPPADVRVYQELNNIKLELVDPSSKGFATCFISSKVVESKCKELICRGQTWIISEEHLREHCIS